MSINRIMLYNENETAIRVIFWTTAKTRNEWPTIAISTKHVDKSSVQPKQALIASTVSQLKR